MKSNIKLWFIWTSFIFWRYGFWFVDKKWNVFSCLCCVLGYILMFRVFLWDSVSFLYVYIYIYIFIFMNMFKNIWLFLLFFFNFEMFEVSKTCFLLFWVQLKGWYALYRIEETELVCAISRKLIIGWFGGGHRGS